MVREEALDDQRFEEGPGRTRQLSAPKVGTTALEWAD